MFAKLIWRWERHRRHPCMTRHREIRRTFAMNGPTTLAVLTVPKAMDDALWSIWSWLSQLDGRVTPVLFVDGAIPAAARSNLEFHFPGIAVHELMPWLATKNLGPQLKRFVTAMPLGKKLAMVMAMQDAGDVIYSDSDVLAFNRPTQLLDCMTKRQVAYFQDRHGANYDSDVLATAKRLGFTWIPNLNSGLLHIHKQAFDPAFLEQVLEQHDAWERFGPSWFSEQTLFALLCQQAGAVPLDDALYPVSLRRQFFHERDEDYRTIAVRHFTGPVRHVMYTKGIPFLYRRERARAN